MEGINIYAIFESGGKQYRVVPGQTLDIDCMNIIEGETILFDKVLLIGDDNKNTTIGKPAIEGAKITATSNGTVRGDKIIVYKFKAKTRYRRKNGHHQLFTRLTIDKIEAPESAAVEPVKKAVHHKKEVKEEAASGS